jgi:hypothetical protein
MMGEPMMLSTPTGEVRNGLCGGGPATGLAASPVAQKQKHQPTATDMVGVHDGPVFSVSP